jgi:hypothetical protein
MEKSNGLRVRPRRTSLSQGKLWWERAALHHPKADDLETGGEILAEMRTTDQTLRSSRCEAAHGPAGAIACPPRVN